jgi:hypothetical protein
VNALGATDAGVAGRDREQAADLLHIEALDVAETDHEALTVGEPLERLAQVVAQLERNGSPLGVLPRSRRNGPALIGSEAVLDRQPLALIALRRQ